MPLTTQTLIFYVVYDIRFHAIHLNDFKNEVALFELLMRSHGEITIYVVS